MALALAAIRQPGYQSFFNTLAESAAALIGLLFVALTLDATRTTPRDETAPMETRAGAALLSFVNVITVSLLALIPGDDPGWAAIVFGLIGLLYTAASIGPLTDWALQAEADEHRGRTSRIMIVALAVMFTIELVFGVLLVSHDGSSGLGDLAGLLVAVLLIGISRTWEIIGVRDPSASASLKLITRRFKRR